MISKNNSNFYQIIKLIFLFLFTSISNLYAHNLYNGGCNEQCEKKFKEFINENKSHNVKNQKDIEIKNSCLNKSLCRG